MGKVFNYLHRYRGFQKAAAFLIAIAMTISMIPANNLISHANEQENSENDNNPQGDYLRFKVNNLGNGGDVSFKINDGDVLQYGNNPETEDALKGFKANEGDKITIWLAPRQDANYVADFFEYRINGAAMLMDNASKARGEACSEGGFSVEVTADDAGKIFEFELEFRNNGGGGPGPGPGPGPENQPQKGITWNTYNNTEDKVTGICYKINNNDWVSVTDHFEMHNFIDVSEGDVVSLKFELEERYEISGEGLSIRYHQDDRQQNDIVPNMNPNEIAEALTSSEGYTFTYDPSSIRDADDVSLYDPDKTMVRVQFNAIKVYDQKSKINIFVQNEVGTAEDGRIIYGETRGEEREFIEGIAYNSEIEFEVNGNRYGGQGIVGRTENDGSVKIKYPSALEGSFGKMVEVTPDEYMSFDAYCEVDPKGEDNEFFVDDELIDELYVDLNHDNEFTEEEKMEPLLNFDTNEVINGMYIVEMEGAESYNIFVRKHRSPVATLSWDYVDSQSDAYVNHGKVYIKTIERDGRVLVDDLKMNEDGSVFVNEDGEPEYGIMEEDETFNLGISKTAGTIWARNGDIVTLLLIPTYGYQLDGAELNGGAIEALEEVSTFVIELNGNLHFGSSFVKSEDVTTINTPAVSEAGIKNGENATDTGNLSLTVDKNDSYKKDAAAAVEVEEGQEAESLLSLDLTLDNIVSKGKEGEYWTSNITEFDNDIDVDVKLNDIEVEDGEVITVVRDHEGKLEELECTFDSETGTIIFPTNKFSTYTVVKKSKPDKTVAVSKITIDPKSVLLKAKDETKTLKATIDPADATDKEVTWSSSDTSVVKVDEQGKLTAVANGKAVITVASKSDPKITAQCDVTVEIPSETKEAKVDVSYRTHVQGFGWQKFVSNGVVSGTIGESKRLESINICVSGNDKLGIAYTTHVQSIGWLPWSSDNEISGTTGESKRLEAIKIILKGEDSDKYDVYYRVHAQTYGWLAWAKNGASAGTSGMSKRLEAIQIVVVEKGKAIDENLGGIKSANTKAYIIGNSTPKEPAEYKEEVPNVLYRTHVQTIGWQNWMNNGAMAGTTGMSKRLEGINIKLTNCPYSGGIQYKTHIQTLGWEKDWKADGVMSGTSGQSKRLEAIQIELTGEMAKHYDVYYRVHAQTYGWLAWAKNGESAGTAGQSKRLEGIQIVLVKKGDKAPANNYGGLTSKESKAFLQK